MNDHPGLLERALAFVAPSWGEARLRYRSLAGVFEGAAASARHFDAARRGRRTEGWLAPNTSANAASGLFLPLMRARCRDLARNNEFAAAMKQRLSAQIVGAGITWRPPRSAPEQVKQRAGDLWKQFVSSSDPSGQTNFYGQQAQIAAALVDSGECFLRRHIRPRGFGLAVPLQYSVLEADYVDTSRYGRMPNGNVAIQGVEFDDLGRRVAYWMFPYHPGEMIVPNVVGFMSERVPAEEVIHVFRVDRPGQVRGVPWLAPAALRLRDLSNYEEAEMARKEIEACFAVFVKRPLMSGSTMAGKKDVATGGDGRNNERIAPGTIKYLQPEEDVTFTAPPASNGMAEHITAQLRAAAVGVGLNYDMASGDLSSANFSSIRADRQQFWALLDQWQQHIFVHQLCDRVASDFAMVAHAISGNISPALTGEFTPPRRPFVNPKEDAQREILELQAGLESWDDLVASRGYDPDELARAIAARNDKNDALGVILIGDGRKTQGAMGAPPKLQDEQAPAAETLAAASAAKKPPRK